MKKTLLALAALTAFAGVASAQSSVTLFGVVDLNARSTKTGSTTIKSLSQDGNASSRLGFRGVEDIGGGVRAGFWLEAGINPDIGGSTTVAPSTVNGAATAGSPSVSQFFNRRSTVSLMGGFGEIRLGRDYTPSFWNYTVYDPFGTNGVGSMSNLVQTLGSNAGTFVRANNTVGYFLPSLGGVFGQVQVAAGERAIGNKYAGLRIGYAGGPVSVAFAFGKTAKTIGPVTSGATGVITSTTMIDDYTDANIGGSFNMGFMTLMLQGSKREYARSDQTTFLVGANIPFGASTLKFSYVKSAGDELNGATAVLKSYDASKISLGYVYDLSKRSAVYAHATKEDRDASGTRTSTSGDVTAYEFGIRHSF